jgi:hypothetical protein
MTKRMTTRRRERVFPLPKMFALELDVGDVQETASNEFANRVTVSETAAGRPNEERRRPSLPSFVW